MNSFPVWRVRCAGAVACEGPEIGSPKVVDDVQHNVRARGAGTRRGGLERVGTARKVLESLGRPREHKATNERCDTRG